MTNLNDNNENKESLVESIAKNLSDKIGTLFDDVTHKASDLTSQFGDKIKNIMHIEDGKGNNIDISEIKDKAVFKVGEAYGVAKEKINNETEEIKNDLSDKL